MTLGQLRAASFNATSLPLLSQHSLRALQQSILLYRMKSQAVDEMMPKLGRSLVRRWITQMPAGCQLPAAN
jgi:hypothetical protein